MSRLIGIKKNDIPTASSYKPQVVDENVEGTVVVDLDPYKDAEKKPPNRRVDLQDAVYESWVVKRHNEQRPHRPRLGASDIGADCARAVWYTWRHAIRKDFPGRLLRLFDRGNREEPAIEDDFKRIGVPISTASPTGGQHAFGDDTGHWRVNLDGIIDMEGRTFVIEMKTMSKASYAKLEKMGGVRYSHPHYYAQMMAQIGTAESTIKIDAAIFVAVCKDNDELWIEEVEINQDVKRRALARARAIIGGAPPPPPLDCAPSAFPCRFCDYKSICRDNRYDLIERSCRTCDHAEAMMGGTWRCKIGNPYGTPCDQYALHKGF